MRTIFWLVATLLTGTVVVAGCESAEAPEELDRPAEAPSPEASPDEAEDAEDSVDPLPDDEPEIGAGDADEDAAGQPGDQTADGTLVERIESGGLPYELSATADDDSVCVTFVAGQGEDEICEWPVEPDDGLEADVITVDAVQTVVAVVGPAVDSVDVVGQVDGRRTLEPVEVDGGARVAGGAAPDAHAVAVIALDEDGSELARVDL